MRRLRRRRFSLVVDFQGYGETALLTWLTGAPERWGQRVSRPARLGLYKRPDPRRPHPPRRWNLSLLGQCGLKSSPVRNVFHLHSENVKSALCCFTEQHLDPANNPLPPALHQFTPQELAAGKLSGAGSTLEGTRPANHLRGRSGRPVGVGTVRDSGHVVSSRSAMLTTAGLMKLSTLVVGGDTGALHLAVAMGKRVSWW